MSGTIHNPKKLILNHSDVMKAFQDAFRKKYPDIIQDNEFEIMLPYMEAYFDGIEANVIEADPPSITKPTITKPTNSYQAYTNNYDAIFGKKQ